MFQKKNKKEKRGKCKNTKESVWAKTEGEVNLKTN